MAPQKFNIIVSKSPVPSVESPSTSTPSTPAKTFKMKIKTKTEEEKISEKRTERISELAETFNNMSSDDKKRIEAKIKETIKGGAESLGKMQQNSWGFDPYINNTVLRVIKNTTKGWYEPRGTKTPLAVLYSLNPDNNLWVSSVFGPTMAEKVPSVIRDICNIEIATLETKIYGEDESEKTRKEKDIKFLKARIKAIDKVTYAKKVTGEITNQIYNSPDFRKRMLKNEPLLFSFGNQTVELSTKINFRPGEMRDPETYQKMTIESNLENRQFEQIIKDTIEYLERKDILNEDDEIEISEEMLPVAELIEEFRDFIAKICSYDEERIMQLKSSLGYGVSGLVDEQKLWFWLGFGSAGKSTLQALIMKALARYACLGNVSLLFSSSQNAKTPAPREDLSKISNVNMVFIPEPPAYLKLNTASLKAMLEGEISYRELYGPEVDMTMTAKLFVVLNEMPNKGRDDAFMRRPVIQRFDALFTHDEKKVNHSEHVYLIDLGIKKRFTTDIGRAVVLGSLLKYSQDYFKARDSSTTKSGIYVSQSSKDEIDKWNNYNDSGGQLSLFIHCHYKQGRKVEEISEGGKKLKIQCVSYEEFNTSFRQSVERSGGLVSKKDVCLQMEELGYKTKQEPKTKLKMYIGLIKRDVPLSPDELIRENENAEKAALISADNKIAEPIKKEFDN